MSDLWGLVKLSEHLEDKVRELEKTVSKIVDQTIECMIFIREYTSHGFFGMSHYPLANANHQFTCFQLTQHDRR